MAGFEFPEPYQPKSLRDELRQRLIFYDKDGDVKGGGEFPQRKINRVPGFLWDDSKDFDDPECTEPLPDFGLIKIEGVEFTVPFEDLSQLQDAWKGFKEKGIYKELSLEQRIERFQALLDRHHLVYPSLYS
ncbi:MAG: hypothetical protein ABIH35_03985 [Patescibacteria group bacterium]